LIFVTPDNQALDRTQPTLPMKKGRAGTMTHDYKRNGTTTLFAALDVLTGTVIGQCLPRHRHGEFLKFLRTIDRQVPAGLEVHMILDNYGTRNHPGLRTWLGKHPRFHLHFTPASSSCLNLVERWFRDLTGKAPRRVQVRARPYRCDRCLPAGKQRPPRALHLDRHRRGDPGEGPPRPGDAQVNHHLKLRHYTSLADRHRDAHRDFRELGDRAPPAISMLAVL
jgi:transposase